MDIFAKKNLNLLAYGGDGLEFFHSIMFSLGYSYDDIPSEYARESALLAIEKLFENDLIRIVRWGDDEKFFENKNFTLRESMLIIRAKWISDFSIPDFYGSIIFGLEDWYTNALEKEGITDTTDWKWFVENKIGDLRQFIKENKPE